MRRYSIRFYDEVHQLQFHLRKMCVLEESHAKYGFESCLKEASSIAAEMAKLDFLQVDKDVLQLILHFRYAKIPPSLRLEYIGTEDRILKLKFHI